MDKLKMETPDLTQANIEKLAALFPACVTEAHWQDNCRRRTNRGKPCRLWQADFAGAIPIFDCTIWQRFFGG